MSSSGSPSYSDEVGEESGGDRADVGHPQERRAVRRRGHERLQRPHAPLDHPRDLVRGVAVRIERRARVGRAHVAHARAQRAPACPRWASSSSAVALSFAYAGTPAPPRSPSERDERRAPEGAPRGHLLAPSPRRAARSARPSRRRRAPHPRSPDRRSRGRPTPTRHLCASSTAAPISSGVIAVKVASMPGVSTPPVAITLIARAPPLICSRTALRASSAPSTSRAIADVVSVAARDRERATGGDDAGARDDAVLDRRGQLTRADAAEIAHGGDARREMLAEVRGRRAGPRSRRYPPPSACEIGAAVEVQMDVAVDQDRA